MAYPQCGDARFYRAKGSKTVVKKEVSSFNHAVLLPFISVSRHKSISGPHVLTGFFLRHKGDSDHREYDKISFPQQLTPRGGSHLPVGEPHIAPPNRTECIGQTCSCSCDTRSREAAYFIKGSVPGFLRQPPKIEKNARYKSATYSSCQPIVVRGWGSGRPVVDVKIERGRRLSWARITIPYACRFLEFRGPN